MLNLLRTLILSEEGQGMTEYAIVIGVIGAGALLFVKGVKENIRYLYDRISPEIEQYVSTIK